MRNVNHHYPLRLQSRGIALIICLLLLLVLTIISVSAVQSTILEEKMAGNMRDYILAFQSSETALRGGENEMLAIALDDKRSLPSPSSDGSTGIWSTIAASDAAAAQDTPWWYDYDAGWWRSKAKTSSAALGHIAHNSHYIIQWLQFVKDDGLGVCTYDGCSGRDFHQVTSYAQGGSTDTVVQLQSTFSWRYQ